MPAPGGHIGATCRAAAGPCDVAETCTGVSSSCPADAFASSATVCRAATGECDLAETCAGSAACPGDARKAAGTSCASDGNPCTSAACNGSSVTCQHVAGPAGVSCRSAAGLCDVPETCDGVSTTCPPDAFAAAGVVCRPAAGECDAAEACSGTAPTCPADARTAAGTSCASDGNPCTLDACDGSSAVCQHGAGNAGVTCRARVDLCDIAETCDGVDSACPPDAFAAAGLVCRTAVGECDVAEACTGSAAACPADTGLPDGDADGVCDAADACPTTPDPDQTDTDGDTIGDVCDPCSGPAPFANGRLILRNADAVPGNDRLTFKGSVTFPAPLSPPLDPQTHGLRLLLVDPTGTIADATLPAGAYDPIARSGWKSNGSSSKWTFVSATGVEGVRKASVALRASVPGSMTVKVTGRDGTYAPAALPPALTVVFTPPFASAGQCAAATFTGPVPACVATGRTVVCK